MSFRLWLNILEKVRLFLFLFFFVDFGVDELMEFSVVINCLWFLSNVIDNVIEK